MAQYADAALWLMLAALPIAAWVIWTDLSTMRIPNKAVVALIGVYAVVGVLVLPFPVWAWSWLNLAVVLAAGFLLSLTGGFGAGDAKFAAAMAPFIAPGDAVPFMFILSAMAIATFLAHRIARQIPAITAATPGWTSWQRRDFPFGVALAPSLVLYLALAGIHGA